MLSTAKHCLAGKLRLHLRIVHALPFASNFIPGSRAYSLALHLFIRLRRIHAQLVLQILLVDLLRLPRVVDLSEHISIEIQNSVHYRPLVRKVLRELIEIRCQAFGKALQFPGHFEAVVSAIAAFGICGEIAEKKIQLKNGGLLTFRTELIDAASMITLEEIDKYSKIEIV